jgi:hypothetical protein
VPQACGAQPELHLSHPEPSTGDRSRQISRSDGAKLATDVVAGLDVVDVMEGVFTK